MKAGYTGSDTRKILNAMMRFFKVKKSRAKRKTDHVRKGICLITPPIARASITPLSNLLEIFDNNAIEITLISGGEVTQLPTRDEKKTVKELFYIGSYTRLPLSTLVKIFAGIIKAKSQFNYVLLTFGAEIIFPIIFLLKLMKKPVILMLAGDVKEEAKIEKRWLYPMVVIFRKFCYLFANFIIIYSPLLVKKYGLTKFAGKVKIASEHIIDFGVFQFRNKISERNSLVGFVGRFSYEKQIVNLIVAFAKYLKSFDVQLLLIGDGPLKNTIENYIKCRSLEKKIQIKGWLPRSALPDYYNSFKLLVLPSVSEGLPNVILEAMACGTPVLATPVGAIPDLVKDCKTGFLLNSTEPKHIAERIIELLGKEHLLEEVSINAHNYVRGKFSYHKTMDSWRRILSELELVMV